MSQSVPPSVPGAIPPKKGLGLFAWLGIGCGGIILLGIVAIIASTLFLGPKLKKMAAEAEKNPAKFAAEMAVKLNPEIELIKSDDETGRITFREKSSGKEITLSYDDIAQGKLTMAADGREISVNAAPGPDGAGSVVIRSGEEKTTIQTGEAAKSGLPVWVSEMLYPNSSSTKNDFSTSQGGKRMGSISGTTTDSLATVSAHYKAKLKEAGYEVTDATFENDGKTIANVTGTKVGPPESQISANILAENGTTTISLVYQGAE